MVGDGSVKVPSVHFRGPHSFGNAKRLISAMDQASRRQRRMEQLQSKRFALQEEISLNHYPKRHIKVAKEIRGYRQPRQHRNLSGRMQVTCC